MERRKRICHARSHLLPAALRQPIKGVCAILAGGGGQDVIEALLSDQEYPPAGAYVQTQCGVAAVSTAADLYEAGGLVREASPNGLGQLLPSLGVGPQGGICVCSRNDVDPMVRSTGDGAPG